MDKPMEQLVGKQFRELVPKDDHSVELLDRVFRTGKPESFTEHEHSKPHPIFWSYSMWPVLTDERLVGVMIQVTETAKFHEKALAMNEALMLGSVRQHELIEAAELSNAQLQEEITSRKKTEEVLRRAQVQLADRADQLEQAVTERTAELSASNRQLDTFVYTIAHDLRAPLRTMRGFSEMLIEDGEALSETGRNLADRINKSAKFMDSLLNDLLAFSRMAQQQIELTSVNLETVVQAVLSRLENGIQEKSARVEIVGPWPPVLAHEPTVGQVLTNLISNALKFVAPSVVPLVRLRTEEHGEFIRVWIEDNGVGIGPDHLDKIFQLFTRVSGENFPGTGIGLAIVEKGIERMGGRVGVESTPGEGSRFWFELRKA
jgi:signal transduction histidine kinase